LWLTGRAGTRKDAAEKVGLTQDYFCRALKKPHVRVICHAWAEQNVTDATLRASSRVKELLDGESEHVAAKVGLRLLESEGFIRPAGGPGVHVNINNGPIGHCVDFRNGRDPNPRPLKPEKQAEYDAWLRGESAGCAIGRDDVIDVTPRDRQSRGLEPVAVEHKGEGHKRHG
jgi:hypothetical protein